MLAQRPEPGPVEGGSCGPRCCPRLPIDAAPRGRPPTPHAEAEAWPRPASGWWSPIATFSLDCGFAGPLGESQWLHLMGWTENPKVAPHQLPISSSRHSSLSILAAPHKSLALEAEGDSVAVLQLPLEGASTSVCIHKYTRFCSKLTCLLALAPRGPETSLLICRHERGGQD